eukprot:CAMPEP_0184050786 /NCGR_PEP_ID=MMETSP0956-20121227/4279_1 /TAXON_ID=627963 /ORGANISM="Aplanochytrium sp, Strain PBS07" /LENGTH=665 /DNA_ID=CAMNT_0026343467 /DNA_START=341 /DNA_END=2338 /DNA_ORIENTATION=-
MARRTGSFKGAGYNLVDPMANINSNQINPLNVPETPDMQYPWDDCYSWAGVKNEPGIANGINRNLPQSNIINRSASQPSLEIKMEFDASDEKVRQLPGWPNMGSITNSFDGLAMESSYAISNRQEQHQVVDVSQRKSSVEEDAASPLQFVEIEALEDSCQWETRQREGKINKTMPFHFMGHVKVVGNCSFKKLDSMLGTKKVVEKLLNRRMGKKQWEFAGGCSEQSLSDKGRLEPVVLHRKGSYEMRALHCRRWKIKYQKNGSSVIQFWHFLFDVKNESLFDVWKSEDNVDGTDEADSSKARSAKKKKQTKRRRKNDSNPTSSQEASLDSSSKGTMLGPWPPATIANKPSILVAKEGENLALNGNGNNGPLTLVQVQQIEQLYRLILSDLDMIENTELSIWLRSFVTFEICRRYLVFRSWSFKKAVKQLRNTIKWRSDRMVSLRIPYYKSPKCVNNPYALDQRVVGFDIEGRPIIYTCYNCAQNRYDSAANLQHLKCTFEAVAQMIEQRRQDGVATHGKQMQFVWVIDFYGCGIKDIFSKDAMETIGIMAHYPELLNLCLLIDSLKIFSATWALMKKVLDESLVKRIGFVKSGKLVDKMRDRFGDEAINWLRAETVDNRRKRPKGEKKAYWKIPETDDEHDARGMKSYVGSPYYIPTPGDAYMSR